MLPIWTLFISQFVYLIEGEVMGLRSGYKISLFQPAASNTLSEQIEIWCNIQLIINPLPTYGYFCVVQVQMCCRYTFIQQFSTYTRITLKLNKDINNDMGKLSSQVSHMDIINWSVLSSHGCVLTLFQLAASFTLETLKSSSRSQ